MTERKLTNAIAQAATSADRDAIIRDSELPGFHLKITPKGCKA
ncbi:MAG TPA: hypothetical protein VLG66_16230 [Alphaproteobacteria bacterium]|nr:hypothetical protein [Alphaproteobacteria bacterium]